MVNEQHNSNDTPTMKKSRNNRLKKQGSVSSLTSKKFLGRSQSRDGMIEYETGSTLIDERDTQLSSSKMSTFKSHDDLLHSNKSTKGRPNQAGYLQLQEIPSRGGPNIHIFKTSMTPDPRTAIPTRQPTGSLSEQRNSYQHHNQVDIRDHHRDQINSQPASTNRNFLPKNTKVYLIKKCPKKKEESNKNNVVHTQKSRSNSNSSQISLLSHTSSSVNQVQGPTETNQLATSHNSGSMLQPQPLISTPQRRLSLTQNYNQEQYTPSYTQFDVGVSQIQSNQVSSSGSTLKINSSSNQSLQCGIGNSTTNHSVSNCSNSKHENSSHQPINLPNQMSTTDGWTIDQISVIDARQINESDGYLRSFDALSPGKDTQHAEALRNLLAANAHIFASPSPNRSSETGSESLNNAYSHHNNNFLHVNEQGNNAYLIITPSSTRSQRITSNQPTTGGTHSSRASSSEQLISSNNNNHHQKSNFESSRNEVDRNERRLSAARKRTRNDSDVNIGSSSEQNEQNGHNKTRIENFSSRSGLPLIDPHLFYIELVKKYNLNLLPSELDLKWFNSKFDSKNGVVSGVSNQNNNNENPNKVPKMNISRRKSTLDPDTPHRLQRAFDRDRSKDSLDSSMNKSYIRRKRLFMNQDSDENDPLQISSTQNFNNTHEHSRIDSPDIKNISKPQLAQFTNWQATPGNSPDKNGNANANANKDKPSHDIFKPSFEGKNPLFGYSRQSSQHNHKTENLVPNSSGLDLENTAGFNNMSAILSDDESELGDPYQDFGMGLPPLGIDQGEKLDHDDDDDHDDDEDNDDQDRKKFGGNLSPIRANTQPKRFSIGDSECSNQGLEELLNESLEISPITKRAGVLDHQRTPCNSTKLGSRPKNLNIIQKIQMKTPVSNGKTASSEKTTHKSHSSTPNSKISTRESSPVKVDACDVESNEIAESKIHVGGTSDLSKDRIFARPRSSSALMDSSKSRNRSALITPTSELNLMSIETTGDSGRGDSANNFISNSNWNSVQSSMQNSLISLPLPPNHQKSSNHNKKNSSSNNNTNNNTNHTRPSSSNNNFYNSSSAFYDTSQEQDGTQWFDAKSQNSSYLDSMSGGVRKPEFSLVKEIKFGDQAGEEVGDQS